MSPGAVVDQDDGGPPPARTDLAGLLLRHVSPEQIRHHHRLPARQARFAPWPSWVSPQVQAAFARLGVADLYAHQARAADLAWAGQSVVLATGTASGKSVAYLLPSLTRLTTSGLATAGPSTAGLTSPGDAVDIRRRPPTALYIAPTKALAADQRRLVAALGVAGVRASTHDGDSSREERAWTRSHANYCLTNPDMLHHSVLPDHERWSRLLGGLSFVVVDECHHYRGVFGANVAHVLRRLRRVARHHGADPVFICASATVADPAATASALVGTPVTDVGEDASGRPERDLVFLVPGSADGNSEDGPQRSLITEAGRLTADVVHSDVRGLTFVSSRKGAEAVAAIARRRLDNAGGENAGRVAAYRGGYLPDERRALERSIRDGSLRALAATSALELGVDITGLDAVVVAGWPGTRASFWQRAGRAGRSDSPAVTVLLADENPLDRYLVENPDAVLGAPTEATVFDPDNPHVLAPHLCAAAAELPLTDDDVDTPVRRQAVEALVTARLLRRRRHGWFWSGTGRASSLADIRGSKDGVLRLVEHGTGSLVGTVDAAAADSTVHPGAVYQHQGAVFVVLTLDLENSVAFLRRCDPGYVTVARSVSDVRILAEDERLDWDGVHVCRGPVEVTRQVVGYLRRSTEDGVVIDSRELDLPVRTLRTAGFWWTLPEEALASSGLSAAGLAGAAHAAEHAGIGMIPLVATCDRWDIGGVSTAHHRDTGRLTVLVYDGYPGGAGFTERGFRDARRWWEATRAAIEACPCTLGCPSCVQSPKCGNGNEPLDKGGAILLLDQLLSPSIRRRDAA